MDYRGSIESINPGVSINYLLFDIKVKGNSVSAFLLPVYLILSEFYSFLSSII